MEERILEISGLGLEFDQRIRWEEIPGDSRITFRYIKIKNPERFRNYIIYQLLGGEGPEDQHLKTELGEYLMKGKFPCRWGLLWMRSSEGEGKGKWTAIP